MGDAKGRSWCFTYPGHDESVVERLGTLSCERMVVGKEVGESGYSHLQGYVRFKEPIRFSWWKNQFPQAHVEKRRGKETGATAYCRKEGDVVIDKGVDFDEKLEKGLTKNEEACMIIEELEKGASYGQVRQRHKLFCFWNRRAVMEYASDEKWFNENPGVDPTR